MLNSSLDFINSEVILILPVARGKGEPVRKPPAPSHGPDTPVPEPESQFRGVLGTKHTKPTSGRRGQTRVTGYLGFRNRQSLGPREKRIIYWHWQQKK